MSATRRAGRPDDGRWGGGRVGGGTPTPGGSRRRTRVLIDVRDGSESPPVVDPHDRSDAPRSASPERAGRSDRGRQRARQDVGNRSPRPVRHATEIFAGVSTNFLAWCTFPFVLLAHHGSFSSTSHGAEAMLRAGESTRGR